MPRITRDEFEAAVVDTLAANGGEMEYGQLQAELAEHAQHFPLLDNMKKRGVFTSVVVATENGPKHMVSLPQ